ncbi:diguanylate cyclase [Spongisporangium articulatum]|uniref:Diguanylate cyclase n=1 Tax=Spongisporangium articulatum TaxID=3362603 RepID=A0ABW8AMJ9_9ACTN
MGESDSPDEHSLRSLGTDEHSLRSLGADQHSLRSLGAVPVAVGDDRLDGAPVVRNLGADWVVRAQDGDAAAVLREVEALLSLDPNPRDRAQAMYARALCLIAFDDLPGAIRACRALVGHCRTAGLDAAGLRGRAVLVDLLRRAGRLEEAIGQLARAMAMESTLTDLSQPDVQAALGALAVALRHCGVGEEADRLERRLASVEPELSLPQRSSRLSNLAFEHAGQAMEVSRRPPYAIDRLLLRQALVEIDRARELAAHGGYQVVTVESEVLHAFAEAATGDAESGLRRLRGLADVLDLGPEATSAQVFWVAGVVRALCRLGRAAEALREGRDAAARVGASARAAWGLSGERLMLSYELMRAENPDAERPGSATADYLGLGEQRTDTDITLLGALFRARVALLRNADERRILAREAASDALTGLVNRRGAIGAVADAAARPSPDAIALLLIDLDGFKEVNDSSGHLVGDGVLREVAGELRTAARQDDIVARWGGDEFVVIAVLDQERAVALADRLRERVRACAERIGAPGITASIGVVVRNGPIVTDQWLRTADEAMYRAKRAGGDATVCG